MPHAQAEDLDPTFIHHRSFIRAHPDLHWRQQGISDYERGRFGEALADFRRAAKYADKPSQAMIAQMLWNGEGVKRDRIMAYVWADLAAERGYPDFIATRERFWRELDPDQQRTAVTVGQVIFDDYGDAVAKKRQEKVLQAERLKVTGSRTGYVGNLVVRQPLPDGRWDDTDGSRYYADRYWKPEPYWRWKDSLWETPEDGKVTVGPLEMPEAQ